MAQFTRWLDFPDDEMDEGGRLQRGDDTSSEMDDE